MPPRGNSLGESLTALLDDRAGQISVIVPGQVVGWDNSTETATVRPLLLDRAGAQRPEIQQCPVVFPGGAYWDIQVGETGLLLVCDEDFSAWWRTEEIAAPETRQNHAIGNAVFIGGLRASTDTRTHQTDAAILPKPDLGGEVLLGDSGATKAALHEDLLTDLNTFLGLLRTWGGTNHANWAVASAAFTAAVTPAINALTAGIGLGNYQSPSVKVED